MLNYSKKLDRRILIPILIILAVFFLATSMQTDFAATNTIDNTTTGGISGALNSSNPGDTIELDNGVYTGSNNTNIIINKNNITIQGKTKDKVILDGQGLSKIFQTGSNVNLTFINLTFINGKNSRGGGVFIDFSNVFFINCSFINNSANEGGAIATHDPGSHIVNLINCNFLNNTADINGGAIFVNGGNFNIYDSTFTNNSAIDGAGVYNIGSANLTIYNSNFTNNNGNNTIYNHGHGATLIVTNCIISNNSGDGILITKNGTAIIVDNEISDNGGNGISNDGDAVIDDNLISGNVGDGVSNGENGAADIVNNVISDNGGNGISNDGDAVIDDNLISGNVGDGVSNGENGAADIVNNVIIDNEGHGISNDGDAYIDNNVISGNGKDGVNNGENGTAIIVDNEISDNGGNGVTNDGDAVIDDNLISGNGGDGVSNGETGTADIVDNVISDNGGNGISNDGDAYIDNNVISGNGKDGVNNGENGTADIIDNEITDNGGNGVTNDGNATLIDNEITDNDGDGVVNNGDLNGSGNTIGQKPILTITTNVSNRTINITVKATDKMGNIIVGATIKIYVNGILIGTGTTNNEGIVEFTYTATSAGTQNILTTMDAFNITDTDNNEILYSTVNNTTSVNIAKTNTRSTIVISNATSGKSTIIRGVLIDENGNTIANATINLVIGGKSNNLVTGADGSWSLSYTPLKAGNFIAKVYYNGNNNYMASTSSLNYTVAQGTDAPKKTDIRLLKKKSSKVFRHGKRVVMKWFTYKNYGATGSKNITTKVIIKNLKYKLWKVYNKKLSYKYGNNKIKFKLNLKSGEKFKLKLKVYKPIR